MTPEYVLASDLGSGGCKTVLVTTSGHVAAVAQQEYPTMYPRPGWAEQDPEDWYRAFCATVRAVLASSQAAPEQIRAVGIVGVTHNTVLMDANDRPLRPSINLFDNRSTDQVQSILERWGDAIRAQTLNDPTPVWTWPQLLWIRENQPDIWAQTRRLLFQKDYVRHRLAPSAVTDVIDAGGSLFFDPVVERWIPEFVADLGIDESWLPDLVHPARQVSEVTRQGAADTGLALGTPVIAGTTDTAAEVLGSGALRAGTACVKLASVGRIAAIAKGPLRQPRILNYRHVLDGLWYPGTASKYAASAFRWLRDSFWPELPDSTAYRQMDDMAAKVAPGSEGLLFHPHLMGEWAPHWNEQLRGDFIGLTIRHGRGHLTRAVLEGVAYAIKDALGEVEQLGLQVEQIRLIGQGSKSQLWAAIMANVLDRPLSIPEQPDAAYGCALITLIGIGAIQPTPDALEAVIALRDQIDPDPETVTLYSELFQIYRDADAALQSIHERLTTFEQRHSQQERDLVS